MRVLSRVFLISDDISRAKTKKAFEVLSIRILAEHNPADYNRAIMDLGATICTPGQPNCQECPVSQVCLARSNNAISDLPFSAKKLKRKERFLHILLCTDDRGTLIVRKRTGKGIWQGLYTPPMKEGDANRALHKPEEILFSEENPEGAGLVLLEKIKHNLTHQILHLFFYTLKDKGKKPKQLQSTIKESLRQYAFPAPIKKALIKAGENKGHIDASTKSAV